MTKPPPLVVPDLPEQFLASAGWQTGTFTHDGRQIAYGHVFPPGPMKACVIILPGRAEFREKYFEVMRDMLARGYGVFTLDWFGQGSSLRYFSDTHKDHSRGFDRHVADLNAFLRDIVTPELERTGHGGTKLIMLAHSMGAHIGLRYLTTLQHAFAASVLTAPMLGIHGITDKPSWLLRTLTTLLAPLHGFYAPAPWRGGWRSEDCAAPGEGVLSADGPRDSLQRLWFCANPRLTIGAPTWGWVHHALLSCGIIQNSDILPRINTPLLFLTAGDERVVDNAATLRVMARIPGARHADIKGARHEIMMEQDSYRNLFLEYFDNFLMDCKIS